jgi:hypothetical protein
VHLRPIDRIHKNLGVPEGTRTPDRSILPSYRNEPGRFYKYKSPAKRQAALDSALRFEVEADCLCPVTYIEFAKQIAQMKFNRIDRHAEFPRQLTIALT